jgi:phytoene dehydrogenase-like protein
MQTYDVVIIGAGHNGLVCAAYLLKAGYSVLLLEKRSVPGGAATTEEAGERKNLWDTEAKTTQNPNIQ